MILVSVVCAVLVYNASKKTIPCSFYCSTIFGTESIDMICSSEVIELITSAA